MKKVIVILFLSLFTLFAAAQSSGTVWESVKENPEYLFGEGWGKTIDDADNNAMQALISKIRVNVSSTTTQTDQETVRGNRVTGNSNYRSDINTKAHATLTNTERVIIEKGDGNKVQAHVGRYITRSEVEKVFILRRAKINDFVVSAMKAEQGDRIDDALKYYYWALVLVNSLQNPNEATYTEPDGTTHMLSVWLPSNMDIIFDNLMAVLHHPAKDKDKDKQQTNNGNDVEILITYKGKPVSSIGYTYYNGHKWSSRCKAKDGIALLSLDKDYHPKNYQMKYAYSYHAEAAADPELESIIDTQNHDIPMTNAYVTIKAPAVQQKTPEPQKQKPQKQKPVQQKIVTEPENHQHKIVPDVSIPLQSNITLNVSGIPVDMVAVDDGYYIGKYEVTQQLWQAVMGSNPSADQGDNLPVEYVSYYDCMRFIRRLNRITGRQFRLPTEDEWRYACSGGQRGRGFNYSGSNDINDVAWYGDNSRGYAHAVGTKRPNELGIYDMCGNVWEWCQNSVRVGGGWGTPASSCRTTTRRVSKPDFADRFVGLRLCMNP